MNTQTVDQVIYVEATPVARAIAIGRKAHMRYNVLPRLGVIDAPMELPGGWTAIPRDMDDSPVPPLADKQVELLKDGGIQILQQIILHEPEVEREPGRIEQAVANIDKEKLKRKIKEASSAVGSAVAMGAAAVVYAATGMAAIAALSAVVAIDPALVCVLEDGTWLVVCTWA